MTARPSSAADGPSPDRLARTLPPAVALWLAIALVGATPLAHGTAGVALAPRYLDWLALGLYLPAMLWLVARRPLDRPRRDRVLTHLAALFGFVAVKSLVALPFDSWLFGTDAPGLAARLARAAGELVVLGAATAVAHGARVTRRLREHERDARSLEASLAEARLSALRSQLDPHFLFNTLNALAVLMHRDVAKADTMLTRLAELLRATLRHPQGHEIPLREELGVLDRYLDIMQLRFGPRLLVERDVPADLEDALVPGFLLQPLVENALEHGVSRRTGPVRVRVAAAVAGRRLRVSVTDDGPGLEPRQARWSGPAHESGGIGLTNTRRRLEELYGDDHALTLRRIPDVGTEAAVELPLRRAHTMLTAATSPAAAAAEIALRTTAERPVARRDGVTP